MKLLAFFVSLALVLAAQTPATGLKNVVGVVTAVDAAAKQIKIKADDGASFTIALSDNTSYRKVPPGEKDLKKATEIALADIATGDRMLARGVLAEETKTLAARIVVIMTKADVAQKQQQERADWQKRGIAGTVTSVSADTKEIVIDTHRRDAKPVTIEAASAGFRRYAPDSIQFEDAKPSSFAALQVGDLVHALGDKGEDGTRFKAEEIVSGAFETIAATVVSVNASTGELVVMDLKTKKPVEIKTNQNSKLRRLNEQMAGFLAMRMRGNAGGGAPGGAGGFGGAGGARSPQAGGAGAPGAGGGGAGTRGGFGGAGGAGGLQQVLDRSPQLSLSELKKGDALIISSSKPSDGAASIAFSVVAGVEPFLAAAPRTAGQVDLGSWSLSVGMPEQ